MNEIASTVILISSFIGAVGAIIAALKKMLASIMKPLNEKLDKMDTRQCRSFLIDFLNDIENGVDKDEVQMQFAYEVYDHYTNDLHKNSYVKDKWQQVME